jgi:uncharacterized protein YegL
MRNDLTEIILIVDRSGSMQSCREDAEGGINSFIDDQKKEPNEARFTLVQFDTEYEFVHSGTPIKDVPKFTLTPRGWTALLDAVGRAINETGKRLSDLPEDQRPGLVTVVIVTDGLENSSKEFKAAQVKEMIERQRTQYNWKFLFLGADENAVAQGVSMGIDPTAAAKYSTNKSAGTYARTSGKLRAMRSANAAGREIPTSAMCFTAEDRTAIS